MKMDKRGGFLALPAVRVAPDHLVQVSSISSSTLRTPAGNLTIRAVGAGGTIA